MEMNKTKLRVHTDALLDAARGIEQSAGDPAAAEVVPETFAALDEALQLLSSACVEAGSALFLPGRERESATERYARAVAAWPSTRDQDSPAPSERVARLLMAIDDAALALRSAARRCEVTSNAVRKAVTGRPERDAAPAARLARAV